MVQADSKAEEKAASSQQSWVFKATCKLTQQRIAITSEELQQWDILFGDLFAVLEREGLLGNQQQAVTDAQSHALPRDIASLTQVCSVLHPQDSLISVSKPARTFTMRGFYHRVVLRVC